MNSKTVFKVPSNSFFDPFNHVSSSNSSYKLHTGIDMTSGGKHIYRKQNFGTVASYTIEKYPFQLW